MSDFTVIDFNDAYYHLDYYNCIIIGRVLLSQLKDSRSRELLEELNNIEYSWDASETVLKHLAKILDDVKIWLKVNSCY